MYILAYTAVFLLTALFVYSPFLQAGKSFIWNVDGRDQHFPSLVYIGRSLRRIALNLLKGEFAMPMFDLNMGLGEELIGNLNSIGVNDPLLLLSVFFPARYSEYLYNFLCVFRLYLAGLTFSWLCFYFHKRRSHTLIASIVYCFSGFGVNIAVKHPFFINPMVILPLLILGTEKILRRERPYVLVFSVFYGFLCGYYHMYMMTLMIGVYALVRFFDLYREHRVKEFIQAVGRGAGSYILGTGLSAIVLLPALAQLFQAIRSSSSNYIPYTYSLNFFINRFFRLITPAKGTGWSYPALAAIILIALALLLFTKGKRTIKLMVLITLAAYWTSIGNMVMNGFQYASMRWSFGVPMILAYVVVEMLPEMLNMSPRQRVISFFTLGGYVALIVLNTYARTRLYVLVGACFLALTLLVLTASSGQSIDNRKRHNWRPEICLLLVVANVGANAIYESVPDQGNYIAGYTDFGYETSLLEEAAERETESYLLDNPEGRVDSSLFGIRTSNTAMVWRLPGMVTYSTVANGNSFNFWKEIEDIGLWMGWQMISTDQRTAINTLLSEKYYVESADKTGYVPYGYSLIKETDDGRQVYENDYALPWGYTYDSDAVISQEELDGMNGLEKQEAMLQAVALEGADTLGAAGNIVFDEYSVPYEITPKNCTWEDGTIKVSKANAAMTLNFDMPAGTEGYLRVTGIDIGDSKVEDTKVSVNCADIKKTFRVLSSRLSRYYDGREDYLVNLGYSDEARQELTITFPDKGTFKLAGIELYALPMDNYPERVEALRAEPLEDCHWGTNSLTGTVDLSKDKILCVSVPYSKGWSATVDGEEVEILRGNYMFMCLPLTAGHHDIEFHYCSPGIKLGAVVSVVSLCVVAGMIMSDRKKRKAGRNNEI